MANKERILIVDDELDFVEACQRTFEAKRYQVMTTSSKSLAQEMMRAEPDIIVLGTLAPAGQAFAMHQWLKQHPRYKDIPLMVIDARYQERYARGWRKFEGMQLESEDYISKPVEPSELVPRVQSLLERRAARKIKVLVIDDHTMVRNGICAVLALQKDVELVGEAADGKEALEKVLRLMPNVALMDIVMPVMSGLEVTKEISKECPQTKVLILTQYDEEENMVVAKKAGAYGFIPKKAASSDLITGIRTVDAGKFFPASLLKYPRTSVQEWGGSPKTSPFHCLLLQRQLTESSCYVETVRTRTTCSLCPLCGAKVFSTLRAWSKPQFR